MDKGVLPKNEVPEDCLIRLILEGRIILELMRQKNN